MHRSCIGFVRLTLQYENLFINCFLITEVTQLYLIWLGNKDLVSYSEEMEGK